MKMLNLFSWDYRFVKVIGSRSRSHEQ